MGKKLIGIAVIATMLFGVFGFAACDKGEQISQYRESAIAELAGYAGGEEEYYIGAWEAIQGCILDGETAIKAAKNKADIDSELLKAKNNIDKIDTIAEISVQRTAARTTLEAYANERKNSYSEENWSVVCGIVDTAKAAINAAENKADVDTAVNEAKIDIDLVEMKDFVLTIMVEKTILSQDEDFRVNVELKNNSGKDVEIKYSVLFWLFTPDIGSRPHAYWMTTKDFKTNEVIQEAMDLNFSNFLVSLDIGAHEFIFSALFYLNEDTQATEIFSNAVEFALQ